MNMFKKGLTGLLILALLGLYLPKAAFCDDTLSFAKAAKETITRHEPKIMATPEKDIPMVQAEEKGKTNYVWIGLGAALLLGLVAAAGGGGGGDKGGTNPDPPPSDDTGDITVGW